MFLASPITFPNLGIEINPSPVAFTVFGKDIYWYGIIIAAGFLLAVFYMLSRAKDFGVTQDDVLDMILWAGPIGVVCARLYYCIFYWELYADDPISILYIWEGGLAIYGGIIGGAITLLVVAKHKKIPATVLLDVAGMGVIIGQLVGRWGNFMNREAHGAVTDTFLKMGLQDASGVVTYYHPTFLYESVWNLDRLHRPAFFLKEAEIRRRSVPRLCGVVRPRPRVDRGTAHRQLVSVLYRHPRQPACGSCLLPCRRRSSCVGAHQKEAHTRYALRQSQAQ